MSANTGLPGVLGELARAGYMDAAWALLRDRGGVSVYIPGTPKTGQPLVGLIGIDAAKFLAVNHGGYYVVVPTARARESFKVQIIRADDKLSAREIARRFGVTERYVHRVREIIRPDPRQLDLFTNQCELHQQSDILK